MISLVYFAIRIQLGQLSQQTQTRYPIVSCGFFLFDWTLLFNVCDWNDIISAQRSNVEFIYYSFQMFAAITTYLTIVLNFEKN